MSRGPKPFDFTKLTRRGLDTRRSLAELSQLAKPYRPGRPVKKGGFGCHITGHHEILLPLLAAAILEETGDAR